MGWFQKKADPISERARALSGEIAALEAQIKQLDARLGSAPVGPRLRSTAMPHGAATTIHSQTSSSTSTAKPSESSSSGPPKPRDPIFEEVDQNRLQAKAEPVTTREHYNELGVRKYDLAAFFARVKNQFRPPPAANPKLVNYLAAGSIQGLRPMRYEKRVARNRFFLLFIVLFVMLVGFFAYFYKHH